MKEMKYLDKRVVRSIGLVALGSFMFSVAIKSIIIPNHFGEGGATGLTLLLHYVLNFDTSWTYFLINAVLLAVGWKYLERKTLYYTFLSMILMTLFLMIDFPKFEPENIIVASISAGVVSGIGLGLVLLGDGTTAGSDILAMLMKKYLGMEVAVSLLLMDFFVVIPLAFVIGLEKAVVTLLMLFIMSKVINYILEGFNPRKSVMIISKCHDLIAEAIKERLDRGITVLRGYGYYSREEKEVLYIVINRRQLLLTQRIIHEVDPSAFVIITDVHQVIGEGFTFYLDQQTGERKLHS